MRERLRRKYLSLGIGEFTAIAVFVIGALLGVMPRLSGSEPLALWAALIPLCLILAQAGTYWLLARAWVGESTMPRGLAGFYRLLRIVNPILLLAGAVVIAMSLPIGPGALILAIAIWVFAVIEYLNYFVVRLSYPLSRWFQEVGSWRTPRLMIDVRDAA